MTSDFTPGDLRAFLKELEFQRTQTLSLRPLTNAEREMLSQIEKLIDASGPQSDELPDLSQASLEYMVDETAAIRSEKNRLDKLEKYYSGRLKALLGAAGATAGKGKTFEVEDKEVSQQRMSQEDVGNLLQYVREIVVHHLPEAVSSRLIELCDMCWGTTTMHQLKFKRRTE